MIDPPTANSVAAGSRSTRARPRLVAALSLFAVLSAGARAGADEPLAPIATAPRPAPPVSTSLKRCLDLAVRNYPTIHEAMAHARAKRADVDVAHYAPYTEFYATAGLAPAPTRRGTNIFSPSSDAALTSHMGLAWQMGVEGTIPLWTFGKITNLWDVTEALARVGEHAVDKEKSAVRFAVRRAYYAAKAAHDSLDIAADAMDRIDRYLPALEQKVASGDADEIDLLKLKMQRSELAARQGEGHAREATALAGLAFLTGSSGGISVSTIPLTRAKHELGPLPRYLAAARLYRPEVNMVRAGVMAQEAQLRLERARYFPDFGVLVTAQWAQASGVVNQRNPYAADTANSLGYGAGLVLNYKLDFLPQSARVAHAQAELEAMRASEQYALGGVGVEVEEAFREAESAKWRLDAWSQSTGFAERWLNQVEQRIAAGTFDEKELFEPTRELANKRLGKLSAIFEYNVALAKLAQATGWEAVVGNDEE